MTQMISHNWCKTNWSEED